MAQPRPARQAAERYVELVNTRDFDGVVALFAEDAVFVPPPPFGGTYRGRVAIRSFYRDVIEPLGGKIIAADFLTEGDRCCANLHGVSDHGHVADIIDLLTVDEWGLIIRNVCFGRTVE